MSVVLASVSWEVQVVRYSPEQKRFNWTNQCPRCGRWVWPRFSRGDGTPASSWILWGTDKWAKASCSKCGGTWPVYETPASPDTRPAGVATVMETSRVEEAIGQETRSIDSGPASAVRRIKATRRWTRHIELDDGHMKTGGVGVAGFKFSAETILRRRYGEETEQIFEEEIELSIPAYTRLELVLHWKRIWQEGVVVGVDTAGATIQIPFRAAVSLTFDQVTR